MEGSSTEGSLLSSRLPLGSLESLSSRESLLASKSVFVILVAQSKADVHRGQHLPDCGGQRPSCTLTAQKPGGVLMGIFALYSF